MILWKKLLRNIKEKKAQYISAWILVIMSSALFYAFTAAGANLVDNLDSFYRENKVEDAHFRLQTELSKPEKVEQMLNLNLEKRLSADVSFKEDTVLRLLSETKSINRYTVIEGDEIESDRDILIDAGFAKVHNVSIGDHLELAGVNFTVKGTMALPDYIYPVKQTSDYLKNPDAFGVAVVQRKVLEDLTGTNSYYSVRFNLENEEELKQLLNKNNRILNWVDQEDNNRITFIKGDISGVKKMGELLPIGILLITLVIVMILLWRLMKKEYVQIGTMYALGYSKREIIRYYLRYPLLLGLSGGVVGTILGFLCMHPLISMFAAYYNLPVLHITPHYGFLLISLLLPAAFFVPFTYLLIRRVLQIQPVILMKGGSIKTKLNAFERIFKFKKLKFNKKFIFRDILRNLPRVGFLVIGVLFATLLLLTGFITKDSMNYMVHDNFKNVYHYNYEYTFNQLQTKEPDSGQIATSIPYTTENDGDEQSLVITGLKPNNTAIQLKDLDGNSLNFDSVIANKSLADKLNIKAGDTIKVTSQLTKNTATITVDHIADSYIGDMIYMPLDEFNRINGLPENSYMSIYSNEEISIPEDMLASKSKIADIMTGYEQIIQPLNYGIIAIAIVAAIIAIIIMYILISLMIEENTYKISLMKVLGYDNREIQKLIISYNLWFVVLGFTLAVPVTLKSIALFLNSITKDMNVIIPVKFDWLNIAIGLAIILAAYSITILLNKKQLQKVSMHEAINKSTE